MRCNAKLVYSLIFKIKFNLILSNKITKGGSDLVWYSIDRDIFKTESIFLFYLTLEIKTFGLGSRI